MSTHTTDTDLRSGDAVEVLIGSAWDHEWVPGTVLHVATDEPFAGEVRVEYTKGQSRYFPQSSVRRAG